MIRTEILYGSLGCNPLYYTGMLSMHHTKKLLYIQNSVHIFIFVCIVASWNERMCRKSCNAIILSSINTWTSLDYMCSADRFLDSQPQHMTQSLWSNSENFDETFKPYMCEQWAISTGHIESESCIDSVHIPYSDMKFNQRMPTSHDQLVAHQSIIFDVKSYCIFSFYWFVKWCFFLINSLEAPISCVALVPIPNSEFFDDRVVCKTRKKNSKKRIKVLSWCWWWRASQATDTSIVHCFVCAIRTTFSQLNSIKRFFFLSIFAFT